MKIIIIHYRYYRSSGPETYLFNVIKLLKDNGHSVIPFSINYEENEKTPYSKYFYEPVVNQFHLNDNKGNISLIDKVKIVQSSFFNNRVYSKLTELINDEKPDIAYVLQYGTKLSTSIFDACFNKEIPVVLRLSDFNLICAKNTFFRNGNICTKCIDSRTHSFIHKCVHDSFAQSFTYYLIQEYNQIREFQKKINAFIVPSKNTQNLISQSRQFKDSDFYHIPTFIEEKSDVNFLNRKYDLKDGLKLCYLGRVSEDKGVDILIDAVIECAENNLKVNLDIIGGFDNEFGISQRNKVASKNITSINFLGSINSDKVDEKLNEYHFSVIPSKWFDNMPNSLIESSLQGVPVIVSRIGSLEELINDGINGFTFEHLDSNDLFLVIKKILNLNDDEYQKISNYSREWILDYCSKQKHLNSLMDLFKKVINEKGNK